MLQKLSVKTRAAVCWLTFCYLLVSSIFCAFPRWHVLLGSGHLVGHTYRPIIYGQQFQDLDPQYVVVYTLDIEHLVACLLFALFFYLAILLFTVRNELLGRKTLVKS